MVLCFAVRIGRFVFLCLLVASSALWRRAVEVGDVLFVSQQSFLLAILHVKILPPTSLVPFPRNFISVMVYFVEHKTVHK